MTSQPEWEGVKLFPIFYIILSKQNSDNRGVKHKYNYENSDENLFNSLYLILDSFFKNHFINDNYGFVVQ